MASSQAAARRHSWSALARMIVAVCTVNGCTTVRAPTRTPQGGRTPEAVWGLAATAYRSGDFRGYIEAHVSRAHDECMCEVVFCIAMARDGTGLLVGEVRALLPTGEAVAPPRQ